MRNVSLIVCATVALLVVTPWACDMARADIVIFDQIGANNSYTNNNSASVSRFTNDEYYRLKDVIAAEQLVLSEPMILTGVELVYVMSWPGSGPEDVLPKSGFNFQLYSSFTSAESSYIGDVSSQFGVPATMLVEDYGHTDISGTGTLGTTRLMSLDISDIALPAGSYWFGVGGGGPWPNMFVVHSSIGNNDARQFNPGGWYPWSPSRVVTDSGREVPRNLGYRVYAIPEPATLLLLGLGTVMLRRKH